MERRRTGETGIFITIIFRSIRAGTYILTVPSPATREENHQMDSQHPIFLKLGEDGEGWHLQTNLYEYLPRFEKPKW